MSVAPFCPPDTPARWVRPRPFRVAHVDLAVRIDLAGERITGEVAHQVTFPTHAPRRSVAFDQVGLAITAASVDGAPARFSLSGEQVDVVLPDPCPDRVTVRLTWSVEHPLKGMFFIPADPAIGQVAMAWTQGAMEDHRHWFPGLDDPNNLSTYRIALTHRSDLAALANGARVASADHGDGWTTTTYVQDRPHVLYLVTVVVGDLAVYEEAPVDLGATRIPIAHWLPRGHEGKAAGTFRATAFAIRWLSAYTGTPFPWVRYGHAVVHRFMWGGMENATLTTISDRVLMDAEVQRVEDVDDVDSLVVHELAHQWYGDLMTMKGWSDIWLNESFATYLEARGSAAFVAQAAGESEADALDLHLWGNRADYLEEDGSRYRRALVTNRWVDAYELFDRVAYEKGSLVLHHLAAVLGEERFRAGLALYTTRHAHDLVETADLRQALEDSSGDALDWFFAQWVERPGHPVLKVRVRHDAGRGLLLVDVEQVGAGPDANAFWRLPTTIAWATATGVERRAVDLTTAREQLVLPCPDAVRWVALDPDGRLLAEWDEGDDVTALIARATDPRLGAQARARALVALGALHPAPTTVAALGTLAADGAAPELVRKESIAALGALRGEAALQALLAAWPTLRPRLKRAAAKALARFRHHVGATTPADLAERLLALGDADPSRLVAGECFAARGALEHPGATPVLRARLARPSWNHRLRAAVVRGLGDSGEAAALDDVLPLLADVNEPDAVRQAACAAAAALGARHLIARDRVRRALEPLLGSPTLGLRVASARALATLADPAGSAALAARLAREPFGNVRRVLRECLDQLGKAAAAITATAELAKRVETLEADKKRLEQRLDALEKRLS